MSEQYDIASMQRALDQVKDGLAADVAAAVSSVTVHKLLDKLSTLMKEREGLRGAVAASDGLMTFRVVCRKVPVEEPAGEVGWRWIAQGLERDICAQSADLHGALSSFVRLIRSHFLFSRANNIEPFRGIGAAPAEMWPVFGLAYDPNTEVHVCLSVEENP